MQTTCYVSKELCGPMSNTDLVFNNGIPEGFCKFRDSTQVFFVLLVASNTRMIRQQQQLVLNPLKGTGIVSALVFILNEQRTIGHSLEQVRASLGLAIIGHGIHHHSKVIQSYKDTLYLSCYPRRSLRMCQQATRNTCMSCTLWSCRNLSNEDLN